MSESAAHMIFGAVVSVGVPLMGFIVYELRAVRETLAEAVCQLASIRVHLEHHKETLNTHTEKLSTLERFAS